MKKISLQLDFDAIRRRIEEDKNHYKPGVWAKMVGVSVGVVSNVHGKAQQKPSLEYIIAAAQAMGRSVDYYLWGDQLKPKEEQPADPIVLKHQRLVLRFKDPKKGLSMNERILRIQDLNESIFNKVDGYIDASLEAAELLKDTGNAPPEPNMENMKRFQEWANKPNSKGREGGKKRGKTGTKDE